MKNTPIKKNITETKGIVMHLNEKEILHSLASKLLVSHAHTFSFLLKSSTHAIMHHIISPSHAKRLVSLLNILFPRRKGGKRLSPALDISLVGLPEALYSL